jgi:hypothetical protein
LIASIISISLIHPRIFSYYASGEYHFADGLKYVGLFKDNRPHGNGTAEYYGGSYYKGDWERGKFGGQGNMVCRGGSTYEVSVLQYHCSTFIFHSLTHLM